MKVWYGRKDDHCIIIYIDPYSKPTSRTAFREVLSVWRQREMSTAPWEKADIHWSGSRAERPVRALKMAAALRFAARLAAQLDRGRLPRYGKR